MTIIGMTRMGMKVGEVVLDLPQFFRMLFLEIGRTLWVITSTYLMSCESVMSFVKREDSIIVIEGNCNSLSIGAEKLQELPLLFAFVCGTAVLQRYTPFLR